MIRAYDINVTISGGHVLLQGSKDDAATEVYFILCTGPSCDCNNLPVVSWDISSTHLEVPSATSYLTLPLLLASPPDGPLELELSLELSAGLVYGQHFITDPSPSSLLLVAVQYSQGQTEAGLNIIRLTALQGYEATITVQPLLAVHCEHIELRLSTEG
ncbi:hypothetical protein QOT17_024880 [Balamuthia mandrillaris]